MSTSSTSSFSLASYGVGPGPTRITGMATGLDIDSMVSEMMMAKTQPIDEMKQREQILQWTRDGYRSMNTVISSFQTAAANLRYQYNFLATKATTDNTGVTATSNSSAVAGTYTMTVHSLATSASLVSQSAINVANNTAQPLNTSGAVTLNVTGATGSQQITIAANSSITQIAADINAQAGATGVNCSYDSATDRLYFTSNTTGANSLIEVSGADSASQSFLNNTLKVASSGTSSVTGTKTFATGAVIDSSINAASPLVFSVNGQNITITNTTTVANLQDQIAKAGLSPNVALAQDASGHITLQSTGNITLADVSGSALADLGLTAGTYNASAPTSVTGTTTYSPMNMPIDSSLAGPVSFTVDGAAINISNTTTLNDIQSQLTAANLANPVTVSVDSNHHVVFSSAANITLVDGTAGSTGKTGLQELGLTASSTTTSVTGSGVTFDPMQSLVDSGLASPISFQINGATVNISNTTTIANLQSQISGLGLSPSVSLVLDANNQVRLQSSGSITLTDGSAGSTGKTALQELGLTAGTTSGNLTGALATGTDTVVDFNGVSNIHFHSSNFLLNNINFSITTPPPSGSSYDVHVTVGQDTDTIYNNIKAFVDAYNSMVDQVTGKLTEQKYYDYKPLTDAQKAQMKDSDITLWNQKAQSGMLQGDPTLRGALDTFSNLINGPVTSVNAGQYKMLSDIGIAQLPPGTTNAYADNGKLYIDDAKLKQAIASNPQQVIALFTNAGNTGLGINTPDESQGIAERLYRAATNTISSLTSIAGTSGTTYDVSSLGLQITDLGDQIVDADKKLAGYQQQYYSQFSQLEKAINNFNSQKQYLNSAFSGGSAG